MQILLNIPEKKAAFFMEHLQQFSYVKATPVTKKSPRLEKKPKSGVVKKKKKKRTESEFLEDLRGAIQELHDYQAGKIQLRTLDEFLDSLSCSTDS